MFSREYKDEDEDQDEAMNDNDDENEDDEENGIDGSSDEDDSSDDDSSDEDENYVPVSNETIEHLEIKVRENQYSIERHLEYINSLRKCKPIDKERLRLARKSCQAIFPLPETVWIHWLEDEKSQKELTQQEILDLFQLALKDFLSIRVWILYCNYLKEINVPELMMMKEITKSDSNELNTIRSTFDTAIDICSDHLVDSPLLWGQYRVFEMTVLGHIQQQLNPNEYTNQIDRIRRLYQKQLGYPQINLQQQYQSYVDWENYLVEDDNENGNDNENDNNNDNNNNGNESNKLIEENIQLQTSYKEALKQLEIRLPYEEKIEKEDSVENWLEYIEMEKEVNTKRAILVFERAIARHSDSWVLWSEYLAYIDSDTLVDSNRLTVTYERAVRNIYWSGDMWVHYLQSIESQNGSLEQLEAVFERSFVAGLASTNDFKSIFNARFDYLWRYYRNTQDENSINILRAHLQRFYDFFIQYSSAEVTMILSEFLLFWAKFEYNQLKSIDECRKQFDLLISFNQQYYIYTEYISIELLCRNYDKCRDLYQTVASNETITTSQSFQDWIDFERLYGDLKKMKLALKSYQKWWAKQEKVIAENAAREQKRLADAEKKRKLSSQLDRKSTDRKRKKEIDNRKEEKEKALKKQKLDRKRVLFVSNISFATTVEQLREVFEKQGELDLAEIVTDRKGRSKGIAFIEYKSGETAIQAVQQLNGYELQGFKLKVDFSTKRHQQRREEEKQSNAAAAEAEEKTNSTAMAEDNKEINYENTEGKTVFINNLAKTVTKEKLQEFFTGKGFEWVDIRLILKQGGRPFAYMDLPDSANVEKALKMNQKYFMGKILHVARSKPPGSGKPAPVFNKPAAVPSETIVPTRKPTLMIPRGLTKKTNK